MIEAAPPQRRWRVGFRGPRPEGHAYLKRRWPWAVSLLMGINALAAVIQWAAGGWRLNPAEIGSQPADWALGAKVPSLIAQGEWWRLVTANFLHASWWHLGSNMLGLLLAGYVLEHYLGAIRTLVVYLAACLAGAITSYLLTPSISLGASTGVFGIIGALIVHHFRYRRLLPESINATLPVLVVLAISQFGFDLLRSGSVDVAGHAGGFVAGALCALVLDSRAGGSFQGRRDLHYLPFALAACLLALCYGAIGLAVSLPQDLEFIRAGRLRAPAAQAEQVELGLKRRPRFHEARLYLIRLRLQAGQIDEATTQYAEAVAAAGPGTETPAFRELGNLLAGHHLDLSNVAYQEERWNDAVISAQDALKLNPETELRAMARNQFAWILADKLERDLTAAEEQAVQAVKESPRNAAYLDTLAWVYYKQGRYREALEQQLAAMRYMQTDSGEGTSEYHYHLGAIQEKLGNRTAALASYTVAARYSERFPAVRKSREALRRMGADFRRDTPERPEPLNPAIQRGIL